MPKIEVGSGDALIVVDVQPTFMPGGGLAVAGGDEIVPVACRLEKRFRRISGASTVATLDRHPYGHISLASSYLGLAPMLELKKSVVDVWDDAHHRIAPHARFDLEELKSYLDQIGSQVLWPDHALAGTHEAGLHSSLYPTQFDHVQVKGLDPACDSYSGFYDNLGRPTGLGSAMEGRAERVFVCGLAFDFCVGWTALDATKALHDVEVFVIEDACRSVNMPGSIRKMKDDLRKAGVRLIQSDDILDD